MRVAPVLCFFLLFLIVLMYSANGSTLGTEEAHSQKGPNDMYGMISRSNKQDNQRSYSALHIVQHRTTMKKSRPVYGGTNDMRHPRNKSSAQSLSLKHSSLLMAAFKHLIFGLLLAVFFY